jgi:aldose 1-epimerase
MIKSLATPCSVFFLGLLGFCCAAPGAERKVAISEFGKTKDGVSVSRYVLRNAKGMETAIINYGASIVSIKVPDRDGKAADVLLGYDSVAGYEQDKSYFGATIGRYGNRIAGGEFTLNGTVYHLPKNDGANTLHGGSPGFNKRLWTAVDRSRHGVQVLEMSYTSADGEGGFPGTLKVKVTFTLPEDKNELRIDYLANTDKDTVFNLTNHSYFNLTGDASHDILGHELSLHAQEFTPVDSTLIPTGELRAVAGTAFDFIKPTAIGARINQNDEQLRFGKGYDHNWVLEKNKSAGLQMGAEVFEPASRRILDVLTTEPGIQFYSGNFLDGAVQGKGGKAYAQRTGFCLETQHFPDSPNHKNFPSTLLKAGQTYRSSTIFRFATRK